MTPRPTRATGVVAPPEEFWDLSWIEVVEISAGVLPECPPDAGSAGVLAEETGGNILSIALRPYMDEAGNFSNTVGYTPRTPGSFLICGYLYNEVGYTWARDEIHYEATAAGSAGGPGTGPGAGGSYSYSWFLDRRLTRVTGARPLAPQASAGTPCAVASPPPVPVARRPRPAGRCACVEPGEPRSG